MTTTFATLFGIVVLVALVVPMVRPRGVDSMIRQARKDGDLSKLSRMLCATPLATRADSIDQVCTRLWNLYERELVAELLTKIAPSTDDMIVQYWMRQVLEIEPEIAAETFTIGFLEEHFNPEVASKCGRRGCCG